MHKDVIKDEINKVLDQLSDKELQDLLSFLKQIEIRNSSLLADNNLEKILTEDKTLLQMLAQ